jgi:hypothetical protein
VEQWCALRLGRKVGSPQPPCDVNTFLPRALRWALRPDQMSEYNTSGMGPGNNEHEANMDVELDPDL